MHVFRNKLYLSGSLLILSAGVYGQDANPEDIIADCARIATVGDRILCLEAAIRTLNTDNRQPDRSVSIDTGTPGISKEVAMPATAQSQSVAPSTFPPMGDSDAPRIAETRTGDAQPTGPASNEEPIAEKTAGQVDVAEKKTVGLGAEQVARIQGIDNVVQRIDARIVAVELVGSGRMRITLDNGQLWQQTGDDDQRIYRRIRGENSVDVEMWQAKTGGYRLHLLDIDRTIRVRRLR